MSLFPIGMTPSMKFTVAGKGEGRRKGKAEGGPPTDRGTHSSAAVGKCAISSLHQMMQTGRETVAVHACKEFGANLNGKMVLNKKKP